VDDSEQPADTEAWCNAGYARHHWRYRAERPQGGWYGAGPRLLDRLPASGRVLALGCGAPVAARCPAAGHDVTGIDLCVGPDRPRDGRQRIRRRCGESLGG